MTVEKARNGDVEIAYETVDAPGGMPLLLLSGAGAQMVMWPLDFCAALAERGFHVVRMDNRDVGLSAHLRYDRKRGQLAYTLRDMTDDVIAVFDALGWPDGHLVGLSLGGVIAQSAAVHHPDRVRSLTSISSAPVFRPWINRPKLGKVLRMMRVMSRKVATAEAEGQRWADIIRVVGSSVSALDEEDWRTAGRLSFEHGLHPAGDLRHLAAVRAAGDRRRELAGVVAPTLVLHGADDPLHSWRAGRATADAIRGARFVSYPGMGHDLPRALWPAFLAEITAIAAEGERRAAAQSSATKTQNG